MMKWIGFALCVVSALDSYPHVDTLHQLSLD